MENEEEFSEPGVTTIRHEWIVPTPEEKEKIIPPESIALLEHIKNYLYQNYEPAATVAEASIMMSTKEVYEAIYRLYPSKNFDVEMISNWLQDGGFKFADMGNLRFEWLLRDVQ